LPQNESTEQNDDYHFFHNVCLFWLC
jgi:hypothetical protein